MYTRGATRSCRTRVPGGFTLTGPTRYRVRVRPKSRRVLRAGYPGTRVPGYPSRTGTRVPVYQRVPAVSIPGNNPRKSFKHAAIRSTARLAQYLSHITHEATMTIHDHEYFGPGTRIPVFATCSRGEHARQYFQSPFKHDVNDPVEQAQHLK